jgi:hypothetical protein
LGSQSNQVIISTSSDPPELIIRNLTHFGLVKEIYHISKLS